MLQLFRPVLACIEKCCVSRPHREVNLRLVGGHIELPEPAQTFFVALQVWTEGDVALPRRDAVCHRGDVREELDKGVGCRVVATIVERLKRCELIIKPEGTEVATP